MIDFSCITTTLVLIKMFQVGLTPITASRPYGRFLPRCVLADLYTSLIHDADHRWKPSSAERLLTAGRPAIIHKASQRERQRQYRPALPFVFVFSLNHMLTVKLKPRTSTLPSSVLHKLQCVTVCFSVLQCVTVCGAPSGTPSHPVYTVIPVWM